MKQLSTASSPSNTTAAADDEFDTELHQAVRLNQQDKIEKLLSAGADTFVENSILETPADLALANGNKDLAERLENLRPYKFAVPSIKQGHRLVVFQVHDWKSKTLIDVRELLKSRMRFKYDWILVSNGIAYKQDHAKPLIELQGNELTVRWSHEDSSLFDLAAKGDWKGLEEKLEAGMSVNVSTEKECYTPLMIAIQNNHQDVVSYLLSDRCGAKISIKDKQQRNAMMFAAESGNKDLLNLLSKNVKLDIHQKIGTGSMKTAYKAFWEGEECVLLSFGFLTKQYKQRCKASMRAFRREVRQRFALSGHPNIVKLLAFTEEGDYVMESCKCNLRKAVRSQDLSFKNRLKWAVEVCQGLRFLHSLGFHHGDLKPENIIIGTDDIAKLEDFGCFARKLRNIPMTTWIQSPAYQSPELFQENCSKIDFRMTDVYAFGILLLWIFLEDREVWHSVTSKSKFALFGMKLNAFESCSELIPSAEMEIVEKNWIMNSKENASKFIECIKNCLLTNPKERIPMEKVEKVLLEISRDILQYVPETCKLEHCIRKRNLLKSQQLSLPVSS